MLKRIAKVCIAISLVLMMLVIILLSVGAFSGNRRWLEREYEKLDINGYTGMSTEDQVRAFMQMVDFMKGKTDTMDVKVTVDGEEMLMYNEREISHMHDVRDLYRGLTVFKYCACAFMLLTVVLGVIAFRTRAEIRESNAFAAKAAVIAFCCVFGFILLLGLWALIDFDSFWAAFHIVFLDLESSTFDPAVSRMIRICPAELFCDMVIRIFAAAFAVSAAVTAGLVILHRSDVRRAKKERA